MSAAATKKLSRAQLQMPDMLEVVAGCVANDSQEGRIENVWETQCWCEIWCERSLKPRSFLSSDNHELVLKRNISQDTICLPLLKVPYRAKFTLQMFSNTNLCLSVSVHPSLLLLCCACQKACT